MPKKQRKLKKGGVYHVWARGNRREPIFLSDDDRQQYLVEWGSVGVELGWRWLAYNLMDNHVHHIVEVPDLDLPLGVQLAHSSYARYFNQTHGKTGHVFEAPFGSSLAENTGALWYFAAYVALNPVRAGMCARPEQHEWSSHAAMMGFTTPPSWLDTRRLLHHFETGERGPLEHYSYIVEAVRTLGVAGFTPPPAGL